VAILIDLPHAQRDERPCRRPGMGGEAATLSTMSKIERVRRVGGNATNSQDITIGTKKELVKLPFGGASMSR